MSSKHGKKREPKKCKSKSQTKRRESKQKKSNPKSPPHNNNMNSNKSAKFMRETNTLKVSLHSSDITDKDHKRSKSPLTYAFTDWYKSHKKHKPKTRQRSQSNIFRTHSQPMRLKNRHKSADKKPLPKRYNSAKPSTPRNQSSKFKKHKSSSPQLKLSRKNDKISLEINAKSIKPKPQKFHSKTPQIKKRRAAVHKIRTNPKKKRTSLKIHKTPQRRSHSANPPKRRSFFGISREKKQKMKSENNGKKRRKNKSFKARLSRKYKDTNERAKSKNETQTNESNHKHRSSLDKLRMSKALRFDMASLKNFAVFY